MRKCPFCAADTDIEVRWVDYGYRGVCGTCQAMGPRHAPTSSAEGEDEAAAKRAETAWEARA